MYEVCFNVLHLEVGGFSARSFAAVTGASTAVKAKRSVESGKPAHQCLSRSVRRAQTYEINNPRRDSGSVSYALHDSTTNRYLRFNLLAPYLRWMVLDRQALGKGGARFTGLVYVFIHYSLLVAYMAQGGGLLTESFKSAVATAG